MKQLLLPCLILAATVAGSRPGNAETNSTGSTPIITTARTNTPAALEAETKEHRDARMAWWREARFGMFIHWGVYSVPAGYYHDQPVAGIG